MDTKNRDALLAYIRELVRSCQKHTEQTNDYVTRAKTWIAEVKPGDSASQGALNNVQMCMTESMVCSSLVDKARCDVRSTIIATDIIYRSDPAKAETISLLAKAVSELTLFAIASDKNVSAIAEMYQHAATRLRAN